MEEQNVFVSMAERPPAAVAGWPPAATSVPSQTRDEPPDPLVV